MSLLLDGCTHTLLGSSVLDPMAVNPGAMAENTIKLSGETHGQVV